MLVALAGCETPEAARGLTGRLIAVPERDALQKYLAGRGIGTAIYYPLGLHQQECFAALGYGAGSLPETERAARESLALPIYPELRPEMQHAVVDAIADFFAK